MTTPPFGPYAPPPPPPPPRKKTGLVLVIVVIALLLVGGGAVGIYLLRKDDTPAAAATNQRTATVPASTGESVPASPSPDPGVCVKFISPTLTNAEITELGCDAPEAAYKVAKRLAKATDRCPSDDYDIYTETGIGDGYALCLMINGKEGACLDDVDSVSLPTKRADCTTATFKVIKAVDGEVNESACPTKDTVVAVTYPEPPTTVCVEAI